MEIQSTPDYSVYYTTEYDVFVFLPSNRPIDQIHLQKIIASIKAKNLLHLNPIIVTDDFEVIDGQHRLEAAKILQVPIYYQQSSSVGAVDMSTLNTNKKNWNLKDYLRYFSVQGNPEYQKVIVFSNDFPDIPITSALSMLSSEPKVLTTFKEGTFTVSNYTEGVDIARQLQKLHALNPKVVSQATFISSYIMAYRLEDFSPEKFFSQIERQPRTLVPCVTQVEYMRLFEELYNYNIKTASHLYFRVTKPKAKPKPESNERSDDTPDAEKRLFVRNLIWLRKQKEMTREELAQHLGITLSAYGSYEGQRAEPSILKMMQLSALHRISIRNLMLVDLSDATEEERKGMHDEFDLTLYPADPVVHFAKNLISIRKKRMLTQEELAKKLNIKRTTVGAWEENRAVADLDMGIRIADMFSTSIEALFTAELYNVPDYNSRAYQSGDAPTAEQLARREYAHSKAKKPEVKFETKPVDLSKKIAVRVDRTTIIYINEGENAEAAKRKYLDRKDQSQK